MLSELRKALYATVKKYPTLWISTMNTDDDHVHLQIEIAPSVTISDAVSKLKSASSNHLRRRFKFIRDIYIEKDGIWSVGYFSSTVGLNEKNVKRYIEWQNRKERPQSARLF